MPLPRQARASRPGLCCCARFGREGLSTSSVAARTPIGRESLPLGSGHARDGHARATRLRRNRLILLFAHPACGLIAIKTAQHRGGDAAVGGAGAILVENIEQDVAPLLRLWLRFRALA